MISRTPLSAMTSVQALCNTMKTTMLAFHGFTLGQLARVSDSDREGDFIVSDGITLIGYDDTQ